MILSFAISPQVNVTAETEFEFYLAVLFFLLLSNFWGLTLGFSFFLFSQNCPFKSFINYPQAKSFPRHTLKLKDGKPLLVTFMWIFELFSFLYL